MEQKTSLAIALGIGLAAGAAVQETFDDLRAPVDKTPPATAPLPSAREEKLLSAIDASNGALTQALAFSEDLALGLSRCSAPWDLNFVEIEDSPEVRRANLERIRDSASAFYRNLESAQFEFPVPILKKGEE